MKFARSPLSLLGLLVSIASLILIILLGTRGFAPAGLLASSLVCGIIMIGLDHFLIRRRPGMSGRNKLLLQSLLTAAIILVFLLAFRRD